MDIHSYSSGNGWILEEKLFEPVLTGYYETLYTLSNGYLGIRGTRDCTSALYRKGTYIAGLFNQGQARVTELVNCPYFFGYKIDVNGDEIDLSSCRIISYSRTLDMKRGVLMFKAVVRDHKNRELEISSIKFVSISDKNLAGFSVKVVPRNFSGMISIRTALEGDTRNIDSQNEERFKHYELVRMFKDENAACMEAATTDCGTGIAVSSSFRNTLGDDAKIEQIGNNRLIQVLNFCAEQGNEYVAEKLISIFDSESAKKEHLLECCVEHLKSCLIKPFEEHLQQHVRSMAGKWDISDIIIDGDEKSQVSIRYNILNLLMLGAKLDGDTSLGAKGLHGEGYKGHIFWDTEIFLLPFYIYNDTDAAKKLLLYRYNRLGAAMKNAEQQGLKGAQFPWESAGTGEEVTPKIIYLPPDRTPVRCWTGDEEIHVTGDVAFAFYEYYRITGDRKFYINFCFEVLLETAKFWVSKLTFNEKLGKYELLSVIGPDEFHVHVDNNYYTNYLARWNLRKAAEAWNDIGLTEPSVRERIACKARVDQKAIDEWIKISDMISIQDTGGVIEQHRGFFDLKDDVITEYNEKGMPVLPPEFRSELDFEGYQLIKQPDVVMCMHMFNQDFKHAQKAANYEYYEKRTTHISSLSPSIYCLMGIDIKSPHNAYKYFNITANADIEDNQGNTKHGIHAASLGGTWQAAVFGFGGLRIKEDALCLSPYLAPSWERLGYKVLWKGRLVSVDITRAAITVTIDSKENEYIDVHVYDKTYRMNTNNKISVDIGSC